MRNFRGLIALAFAAALTASVPATSAQSPVPMPRALEPASQLPLEGSTWRLRDYRHKGVDRSAGPEVAAWMTLHAGDLRASGGCTRFRGRYGVVGSALAFRLRRLKDKDCGEQTTIVQSGMVDGLRRVASYQLIPSTEPRGTELVLHSADGLQLLRFEADDAAVLEIGEWQLVAFTDATERVPADPGQPAVLAFQRQRGRAAQRSSTGRVVGSTGCNGLIGDYFRSADVLSFGELERTDAPCAPSLERQEAKITEILDATSLSLQLLPDSLVLTSGASGDSLEFTSSSALEGTTWLLSRLPAAPAPDGIVTLRLDGGRASGEGPCGGYSATYATDGVFLSFGDTEGSDDAECRQAQTEKALLAALQSTVLLDRTRPEIRFLDARGKVLARFKDPGRP